MKNAFDLSILPTYSEDGSVITIVLTNANLAPIRKEELIEALEEYINYLSNVEPQNAN